MLLYAIAILPLASSLLAVLLRGRHLKLVELASTLSMGIVLALTAFSAYLVSTGVGVAPTELFAIDHLSAIILAVIAFVGTNAMLYSSGYLEEERRKGYVTDERIGQYYALLNAFLFAMFVATMSSSPILMWIAIEATTLATVFLIAFYDKASALEAAWKYVVINSVGLLLGFIGMVLLIATIGAGEEGSILSWVDLASKADQASPVAARVAFLFILVGFGTKVGLAPMHTWLPDAHSKAPVPVSALLSGVLLNVAFLAVLRFKSLVDSATDDASGGTLLIGFGALSVVLVAFTLLRQRHYKRMLAYSSIENMGLIAIGAGVGGVAAVGAVLHIVYHALAKSLLFMSSGNVFLKYSTTKISEVRGLANRLPVTSVLFAVGVFVLMGMPPFGVFASKFAILSGVAGRSPILLGVLLLALILVFVGFLRHTVAMLYGEPSEGVSEGEAGALTLIPLFVILGAIVLISFYLPEPISRLIDGAVDIITK